MKKIIIDKAIFNLFPDFKRGIIMVSNLTNASGNKRIKKPLNQEIEKRIGPDWLQEHCQAELTTDYLNRDKQEIIIPF